MKKQLIAILLSCSITSMLFVTVSAEDVKLSVGDKIEGFTVTETGQCKIFDADTVLFTHDKTGGRFLYVANDDTNRAFDIAFNTPAEDTGVSHVFEHASLNGSEKYPANIFFNVGSKTINTFMNAFTTMRNTYYPVSSLSDEQLLRLADYYLDGVFNPLIITDESIFEQEAWRYDLSSPEDELTLNGTVYSEMKGSITPFGRAYYNTMKTLYPGSSRSAISGGDPDVIPELTYDDVVKYHEAYYKPSNSLVILYGKTDYEKYLMLVDEYFSEYDDTKPVIDDPDYAPVSGNIEKTFRIPGNEDTGSTVIYAVPCAINDETEIYDMALCADFLQSESSSLKQKMKLMMPAVLLTVSFDFSLTEPTIAFIASNVQSGEEAQVKEIIEASAKDLAEEGFSEDFMDAYLTSIERNMLLIPDSAGNKGIGVISSVNNLKKFLIPHRSRLSLMLKHIAGLPETVFPAPWGAKLIYFQMQICMTI